MGSTGWTAAELRTVLTRILCYLSTGRNPIPNSELVESCLSLQGSFYKSRLTIGNNYIPAPPTLTPNFSTGWFLGPVIESAGLGARDLGDPLLNEL